MNKRIYILISTILLGFLGLVVLLYTQISSTTYIDKNTHLEEGPMKELYKPFFWLYWISVLIIITTTVICSIIVFINREQFGIYEQKVFNQFKINILGAGIMLIMIIIFWSIDTYLVHSLTSWVTLGALGVILFFQIPLTYKIYRS